MFRSLITIHPLGMMYGSAGGFLSPQNLVGRSRSKFPPDAATIAGLIFNCDRMQNIDKDRSQQDEHHQYLKNNLSIAGPFWAESESPNSFYVPIPWTKVISKDGSDEWYFDGQQWHRNNPEIEPEYQWQRINAWNDSAELIRDNEDMAATPWEFVSMLHPQMKDEQRHVLEKDGLFLENAVQMPDDICLVYLSKHPIEPGWHRLGGENHIVEIQCRDLDWNHSRFDPFHQPINDTFALIAPGVWGSNRFSYRYPQHPDFPKPIAMLTDKPIAYRYRTGRRLGRGRYAVPPGSVYKLETPIGKSWQEWSEDWFPMEGFPLKRIGAGLCLALDVPS